MARRGEDNNHMKFDELRGSKLKKFIKNNFRYSDLLTRCRELDTWTHDLMLPAVVWLGGLFNPQSFLTAIMQVRFYNGCRMLKYFAKKNETRKILVTFCYYKRELECKNPSISRLKFCYMLGPTQLCKVL